VVYLVRSFRTNARIRSLTTGTFNLVVKDRIAFRLSGAPSVQANPHKCESDCPRNLTNISFARNPVNPRIPQTFHGFSTFGMPAWDRRPGSESSETARNDIAPRFKSALISVHAEAEDRKLGKDPSWRSLL
jgi:hypothetical protein